MLFDQRVPMRDGVTLSADVTLPAAALEQGERVPVILMRTPYVKSNILTVTAARYYAERGYAYVAMDVRGRGDSDGVFDPRVNDGIDGYDAIEWLRCTALVGRERRHDRRLVSRLHPVAHRAASAAAPACDDRAGDACRSVCRDADRAAAPARPLLAALRQRACQSADGVGELG